MTLKRAADFGAYVLLGLLLATAAVWFASSSIGQGKTDWVPKWGGLILNTAILYGYVVKESKPFWHAWGFWLATVAVLVIHLAIFSFLFHENDHWSVLWFLLMYPIEFPVLLMASDWAVHVTGAEPKASSAATQNRKVDKD